MLFRTSVALIAAGSVFSGCGGSDGSRNEGSFPDSGQDRDVVVVKDIGDASAGQGRADVANQGDADGASCGPGSGAFAVSVGNTTGAACDCDWYATGTDASATSGTVETLEGFFVGCVPAGTYAVGCSCGPTGVTGPPDADQGCCTGGSPLFSVAPATSTNVAVDVACPE